MGDGSSSLPPHAARAAAASTAVAKKVRGSRWRCRVGMVWDLSGWVNKPTRMGVEDDAFVNPGRRTGPHLAPRPCFLVDDRVDSALNRELQARAARDKKVKPTQFSIGPVGPGCG